MKTGLKHLHKKLKGSGFKWKIKEIHYELKYAWQRAWRGYDDVDVWAFRDCYLQRAIPILEDYKENHDCHWWCPDGYDWSKTCEQDDFMERCFFSTEQIDAILDTLIFHLKMTDEDYVEKHLYGKNVYDDDYEFSGKDFNYYKRIANVMQQNKDLALDLLKVIINEIWY